MVTFAMLCLMLVSVSLIAHGLVKLVATYEANCVSGMFQLQYAHILLAREVVHGTNHHPTNKFRSVLKDTPCATGINFVPS